MLNHTPLPWFQARNKESVAQVKFTSARLFALRNGHTNSIMLRGWGRE